MQMLGKIVESDRPFIGFRETSQALRTSFDGWFWAAHVFAIRGGTHPGMIFILTDSTIPHLSRRRAQFTPAHQSTTNRSALDGVTEGTPSGNFF
jgi:hypothetical protein